MSASAYVVAIVVDPGFGERLHSLTGHMPVWVVDTPTNRVAAQAYWQAHPGETHITGVTTFRVEPVRSPEEWCTEMLGTVLEHHGEYSHNPPVSILEVFGARPVAELRAALAECGFSDVAATADGFRARAA